jgi:hypothetical protein
MTDVETQMTNVQIPNPNEIPMSNFQCQTRLRPTTVFADVLIENWSLSFGISLVIGIWTLVISSRR